MKLRVLHIIPSLNKGAAERITFDICNFLANREDCEVFLVLIRDDISYEIPTNLTYQITSSRVKLSVWKKNKFKLKDFETILSEFKPQIIHSHLFEAEVLSRARTKKDLVYISHIHDNINQFNKLKCKKPLKRKISDNYERIWLFKRYKKTNNQFISISSDTTHFLHSVLPFSLKKNILSLSNAIDYKLFKNTESKTIGTGIIRLISVGSLVPKKNHRLLIEIAILLKSKKINFEILILGDGVERINLEEEIAINGLSNYVKLFGNVNDVSFYLNHSTLFLHTATYEPFGLVLLEAMASGLPVISLDGGGNRDVVLDGQNGYLIRENNAVYFVEKIQYLASEPNTYAKMSDFARQFSEKFDIANYIDELVEYYKQLLLNKHDHNRKL